MNEAFRLIVILIYINTFMTAYSSFREWDMR